MRLLWSWLMCWLKVKSMSASGTSLPEYSLLINYLVITLFSETPWTFWVKFSNVSVHTHSIPSFVQTSTDRQCSWTGVLNRLHYCKTIFTKIFESVSPCVIDVVLPKDHCHTYSGPVLGHFWWDIFNWFSKQYGTRTQPDSILAIFGFSGSFQTWH